MNIKWINKEKTTNAITIYNNNITLSKQAAMLFEDAYGILFFKLFVYGLDKFTNIKHLMIDEMQDYTPVQMYILEYLFECPKTILGDYNQSLQPKLTKNNFEKLGNVLSGDNQVVRLNKSYRSTMQIAEFFNVIGVGESIDVVSREGEKIDTLLAKKDDYIETLTNLVEKHKNLGYNSIGIVTKDNEIARNIYKNISKTIQEINLIDDNIDSYDNKVCVISAVS